MPIILAAICLLPLLVGLAVQYAVYRLLRRRIWRALPALAGAGVTVLVAVGRWNVWTSAEISPLTQILFVPVLPAVFYFLGLVLGRKLYKRVWDPRVVKDK